jgi:hypothetical protein
LVRPVTDEPRAWDELRPVLDAELARLPVKYRAPVVLCYLEGKTNEDAARQLGWPTGTVKCRLSRARDLLRDRLTRRGLALSSGLLAPSLTEPASAAVTPELQETTTRAAGLFAAGNTLAVATAPRAVPLAEGVLKTMFLSKLQTVAAVVLVLGLVGTGAGALWSHAAAVHADRPEADRVAAASAADRPEAADKPQQTAKSREQNRIRQNRKKLDQLVDLDGISADTPLKDALELLSQKFEVQFHVNKGAFEAIGIPDVDNQPVELPKMKSVRLGTVLRQLLGQLKGESYFGTFTPRPDYLEVTTTYQLLVEALGEELNAEDADRPGLGPPGTAGPGGSITSVASYLRERGRRPTPVVYVDCDNQTLADALHDLAVGTGFDVVIDLRVADKTRMPVSLAVNNVLLDTALNLLVDLGDVDWIWMDKVIYVTSKENAKAHKERVKAAQEAKQKAVAAAMAEESKAAASPPDPLASRLDADFQERPLKEALQELAQRVGASIVVDPRAGDKAKMVVTATFTKATPETIARVLADLAELRSVRVDSLLYITTKENARAMQDGPHGK